MEKKISVGVYSGAESDLYGLALTRWGYEAQALKCIEELAEFIVELSKKLNGYDDRGTLYLGELLDAQIMLNQMVHNELNNPVYWMLRKQKIERLKNRLLEEGG